MRIALFLFVVLFSAPVSEAALIAPSLEVVGVHVAPRYPGPEERAVVTVTSTGNPDDFAYEWTVDGRVVAQGFDARTITVETGAVGTRTEILVRLLGPRGEVRGEAVKILQPGDVDIVWEGKTFVPPLYAGRPLVSGSSSLTALAVPYLIENGKRVSAAEILYEWSANGQPIIGKSGRGKSALTLEVPFFNSAFTISVVATSPGGAVTAEGTVTVAPVSPVMAVYEDVPLSGVNFERAQSGAVSFIESEMSFRAYPYFVADPDDLVYTWEINGVAVTDPARPRHLVVRKESGDSGTYTVQALFRSATEIFEKGLTSFNLTI